MIRRLIILLLIVGCVTEPEDCAGIVGGAAELDNCNVCDSDPTNDCVPDCYGEWGGDATEEECATSNDLQALQDIIDLNNLHPSDAPFYEPTEIGEQTWTDGRLTSLNLDYMGLDTLSNSISYLTKLEELDLNNNNLQSIPDSITALKSLINLEIENNHISELPSEFCSIYNSLANLQIQQNSHSNIIQKRKY